MNAFIERNAPSAEFEDVIIDRLNDMNGWKAFKFGQSQLPQECRDRLHDFADLSMRPSLIRWMPDIIAFRDYGNANKRKVWVVLIDAKTGRSDTQNYAIEKASVETMEVYTDKLYTPTFFVFKDWKVMTPRDAKHRGSEGPPSSRGSGTPYILVPKKYATDFEEWFNARPLN